MFIIPTIDKKKNQERDKSDSNKYMNILTPINFFSNNEIEISQRILKIPNYSRYFNPILKNQQINISEIDDEDFDRVDEMSNLSDILIIKRRNIQHFPSFFKVFYELPRNNPRKYMLMLINSYKNILDTIKCLEKQELINLDFHPKSLVYADSSLLITDLSMFFHYPTMNKERISNLFSKYNKKNALLPQDAHLICFLVENHQDSLSSSNIDEIIQSYESQLRSLSLFKEDVIEEYKDGVRFSLQSFINRPKESIIKEILRHSISWNNYGISALFLVLLRDIWRTRPDIITDNKFIYKFSQLLMQNLHPILEKRQTIEQNISLFNDILYGTDKREFLHLFSSLS